MRMVLPCSAAIFLHSATRLSSGHSSLGPQAVKFMPSLAEMTIRELATLFRASPMKVKFLPFTSPSFSSMVSTSASICVGWN